MVSIVIGLAVLLSVILIGLAIARNVMRQLGEDPKEVADIVSQIADGILDNPITLKPGDTSSLLANMKNLQTSINNFVIAQHAVAQKHAEGWIFEKIDASKFPGTFGSMANEINELVATHVAVKMQVIDIVSEYAKGDFSHQMDRLPGDKAKVTAAVDAVKSALLSVNNEIKTLVEAGVNGDFSKRSHADQFQFIFKDILNDIDILVATCENAFDDTVRVAQALAEGDLTQTVTRDYPGTFGDVKDGLNTTVENLKSMISEIKEAGDTISTAAKEIAAGNNDLSHRTEEQAASLEETAASMQELTSTVQHNSENAKHANELAVNATDTAGKGVNVVKHVVETMQSINESSRRVVDIIGVIDGIAFQTNILALNAAVEAARAGEQGRGFAVVAGEVRNLAQRAAAAAGEIKALIGDSVEQIEDGTRLVTNAGKTMEEIVNSIRGVTVIMSEIASASVEQTAGIQQVNLAIGQMDDVTQQNAALVEQAAAAAESLEEQTQSLSATIGQFKVDGRSAGRSAPASSNAASRPIAAAKPANKVQTYQSQAAQPTQAMPTINFDDVLQKHSAWKVKLRAAINQKETLDADTISKDNCCDFGKWLYGDAKTQVGQRASYTECVKKHAAFHVEAGKIATLINAKKYQEADHLLAAGSTFNSASNDVGIAVMRLKKDATTPPKQAKKPVVTDEWEEF
ncbi:MAG: chemotaxis protein [Methylococcaceae bacterium]|nr:chemotaxis protein [Methylococcaceae bacterium]